MQDASLENTLRSVFSILPAEQVEEATFAILQRLEAIGPANADDITWADFAMNGTFLRGGFSSSQDKTTQLVSNSQEAPEIAALSRMVAQGEGMAGALKWKAAPDRLYWFVPMTPSSSKAVSEPRLRGFSLPQSVFSDLLISFNPAANATKGELRAAFQLTGNAELRSAADTDKVAYETKRGHVKSLCAKMHCNGQRELVSKIVGQMVHLLSVTEGTASHSEILESFVARYLSNDVVLKTQRLPNGKLLRFFECGAPNGRQVVMIHGIMFPISLYGLSAALEALDIKLIVPIRDGFFEDRSLASFYSENHISNAAFDDLALFLSLQARRSLPIIGNSFGAALAIKFAQRHPDFVEQLILLGTNLKEPKPHEEHTTAEFYGAMKSLSETESLFKMVSWQFKKYYADEKTCTTILRSLFGACSTDLDVLDGKFSQVPAYRMFSETYQNSLLGMAEGLGLVMHAPKKQLDGLSMPVSFIQGADDPLTSVDYLKTISDIKGLRAFHIVNGAGHFLSVSHTKEVWRKVLSCLE